METEPLTSTPKITLENAAAVDNFVGQQVRALRTVKGLTQTDLGRACGISFQQIQKYEKGANRISASKLALIAQVLEAPISQFFPGHVDTAPAPVLSSSEARVLRALRNMEPGVREATATLVINAGGAFPQSGGAAA